MKYCYFKSIWIVFLTFLTASNFAQKIDMTPLKNMNMRSIGPAGMSGRVTAIDVLDNEPHKIYIGTASGGVWKSWNGGVQWEPIFDKEGTQSVGSLAINQSNPDEIWVGTGEGNPRNSQNSGIGIFRTLDGGQTWTNMGLQETKTIHRIHIHRDNPNIIWAGALGSAWGPNPDRGVFKTTDGGKTWKKVLFVNDSTGCADLVVDLKNPNKLIAAMWEYGRKPWHFNSGGKGSGIYISFDGGETWEKRTEQDGLPKGDLGRVGLAISASNPQVVYALVEAKDNALYRSDDGGKKWRKMADKNMGDRPFYYSEIYVDPNNENRIYSIHSIITKSEDGGKSFETFANWNTIHPDHHAYWISPSNPNYMIDGNDGGVNITYDGGKTWRFIENLPLGQFYHVNIDDDTPYNLYGGLQDNGSWVGQSNVWKQGGITNSDWREVLFGDGFDVMPKKGDNRYGYAMSQGGELYLFDMKSGKIEYLKPVHPQDVKLRYNWNSALAQNPFHAAGIYYGSQFVHKSMDNGKSWEIISPDLTTNDTLKLLSEKSGGLTPDVTSAENHCTIICIAPSPKNENVIWAGTDDGNLQLTTDGGKTWTNLSGKLPDAPKNGYIPQIEVSSHSEKEAFVVVNHYRFNDWKPYLFHTKDGGVTWKRIADEKQVKGHCLSVVQDLKEPNLLFLGTDQGLYISIDYGENWNKWQNNFPSVPVMDMKIHPRENDLVIATFGRSNWIMDDISPLRELARSKGNSLSKKMKVFESSDAYLTRFRSVDGVRFVGNSYFSGDTKTPSGIINVWIKKDNMKKEEKKPEKKDDSAKTDAKDKKSDKDDNKTKLKIYVIDYKGDTIRKLQPKVDTGMNRIVWRLDAKSVRYPSWAEPKPDADEPGGASILPGRYKIKVHLDSLVDSTWILVRQDPNTEELPQNISARMDSVQRLYKNIERLTKATDNLREMDKTIKLVGEQWVNVPDSIKKDVIKLGTALKDSISNIKKEILGDDNEGKGIQRNPETVMRAIWKAFGYVNTATHPAQGNSTVVLRQAHKKIDDILIKINQLISTQWKEYQTQAEKVQYSLFKKIDPIELKN